MLTASLNKPMLSAALAMRSNFCSNRCRTSSTKRAGETAAIAADKSSRVTFSVPIGALMASKMVWCSSSPWTPTLERSEPNSDKVSCAAFHVGRALAILDITCRMDVKPSASHFLRSACSEVTGKVASTAPWNSLMETKPFSFASRKSKILSSSPLEKWRLEKCRSMKRRNSVLVSSVLRHSFTNVSKAFVMVENFSSILARNRTKFFSMSASVALCPPPASSTRDTLQAGRTIVLRGFAVIGLKALIVARFSKAACAFSAESIGFRGKTFSSTIAVKGSCGKYFDFFSGASIRKESEMLVFRTLLSSKSGMCPHGPSSCGHGGTTKGALVPCSSQFLELSDVQVVCWGDDGARFRPG
mmetsp:Transcript_49511/g.115822  ORF Transcript_49511/g.115822 Transcript_49511/m.115822 type:complete len:358 (-) Transcript_49511:282-1355(-)